MQSIKPVILRKLKLEELNRISVADFKESEKNPVVVVLDNIRSMNNIGSVFRTSDAFRIEKIYLCGITAVPPHREIHRTALGSEDSVSWHYFEHTTDAIQYLQTDNYEILAVEQTEGSTMLQEYFPEKNKRYAFVFGNEVDGVDEKVLNLVHKCLEIPQFGSKHSLNISVSVGILLWDYVQKTHYPASRLS